jgi:transposase
VRRDFLEAAKRWPQLQAWMFAWVEAIGELYHLNKQRLAHWDETRALEDQTPAFRQHHQALVNAIEQLAERGDHARAQDNLHAAQRDVLNSLNTHWLGLLVFVTHPQVPMDNNTAERRMRNPGMGRKNYYGSARQWSAELAAMLFSLFQTVLLWQLNPHHWLYRYLTACAENGGQPPADLSPFIPWQMSAARQQQLAKPLPMTDADSPRAERSQPTQQPP